MKVRTGVFHRWMALFLCIVMFASMLPVSSAFAEGETEVTVDAEETVSVDGVEGAPAETNDTNETGSNTESVPVIVKGTPEAAKVTIYQKNANEELQEIQAGSDGYYYLEPGTYYYSASCEGYEAQEAVAFTVQPVEAGSAVQVSVALEKVQTETIVTEETVTEPEATSDTEAPAETNEAESTASSDTEAVTETTEEAVTETVAQTTDAPEEEVTVVTSPEENVQVDAKSGFSLSAPVLRSVTKSGNGLKITWDPVTGGNKYRVFRKNGSSWKKLADTTAVSYIDTGVSNGTSYTYTVRCVSNDGSKFTSSYDSTGKTATYWSYDTPKISSVTVVENGIRVTWNSVGAAQYRVFHKGPGDSSWVGLGNVSGTSFTDKQVVSGNTYAYTVRCISADGKSYTSDFKAGTSRMYLTKVQVTSVENVVGGVNIKWTDVPGCTKYKIQRKLSNESWNSNTIKSFYFSNTTSMTDKDVSSDNTYTYRVMCVDSSNSIIGIYDETGKTIAFYDAPELDKQPTLTKDGVTINWHAVKGVTYYRVFRKVMPSGGWKKLADVTTTTYTDKNAAAGSEYVYTVRCVNASGAFISSFDSAGISTGYTNYPILVKTGIGVDGISGDEGITVTWKKVEGAEYYQIYRKAVGDTEWIRIEKAYGPYSSAQITYVDTGATGFIGTEFIYTVRCVDSTGAEYKSTYDANGIKGMYYPSPNLTKAEPVPEGINITWEIVPTAPKYQVYRKIDKPGAAYVAIGTTTDTVFTDNDKELTSGVTYRYAVCVLNKDGKVSSMEADGTVGIATLYYGPPKLKDIGVVSEGIKIRWIPVADITTYRILRKTENGSWSVHEKTAGTKDGEYLVYTDTKVTSGTTYTYTVSCESGGKQVSGYDAVGLKATYYGYNEDPSIKNGPTLISCENKTEGIYVKWNKVDGVEYYNVYRRERNTTEEAYALVKTVHGTSFVDESIKNKDNEDFYYSVRCVDNDGKTELSYFAATTKNPFTRHVTPILQEIKVDGAIASGTGTVTLSWRACDGITNYRIYRKEAGKSWSNSTLVGSFAGTSYTDTPPKSGVKYTYTVSCLNASGERVSDYNGTGLTVNFLMTPDLVTPAVVTNGITVKWKSVDGAEGYRIYRKLEGAQSWSHVKTVSGYTTLTWTDTDVLKDYKYTYTVRAYNENGNNMGGYRASGITQSFSTNGLSTPTISSISNGASGVVLKWSAVSGATSYQIDRKLDGGSWSTIGTTSGTTYTDTTASSGTRYIYRIFALKGSQKSSASGSKEIVFYGSPQLISAKVVSSTASKATVRITWKAVSGVTKYRVFWRTANSGWKKLADVKGTSYDDPTATVNHTYYFTVRGIDENGNFITGYDSTGLQVSVPFKLAAPKLVSASASIGKVTVKWNAVSGAEKYRVFRKLGDGGWKRLADTTSLSFEDKTAKAGNTYVYTIRCINGAGTIFTSPYESGLSVKAK